MPYFPPLSYTVLRPFFWAILKLFRLEISGRENLIMPESKSVILAGNHQGYLDGPMVVTAFLKPVRFVVAQDVLSWAWVGPLVRIAGIFPIARQQPRTALMKSVEYLNEGNNLCIFPEGKLTDDGAMADFQKGVIFLQQKSRAPIVPFAIHGGFDAWRAGVKKPHFRKVYIRFGTPIYPGQYATFDEALAALQHSVQQMKAQLEALDNPVAISPKMQPSIPTFRQTERSVS